MRSGLTDDWNVFMAAARIGKSLLDKFKRGDLVAYHTGDSPVFRVEGSPFFDGSTMTGAPVVLLANLLTDERVTECVLAIEKISPLEMLGMQAE